jgi:Domain of unknown function (DUF5668)
MDPYMKNPECDCSRCRSGRLFGPAMIITIGALFLIDQNSYVGFDRTWPVILLVAGLFSYLGRAASLEGHVQPYVTMPAYPQQGYVQPGYAQATPAPASGAAPQTGPTASTPSDSNNDSQVKS